VQQSEGPSGNPYIISSSTPSSANLASLTSPWPQFQGINTAYRDISHHDWQPRQERVNISTPQTTQQQTYLPSSISSFAAAQYPQYQTSTDIHDLWPFPFDYPTNTNLLAPMQDSRDYPTPHSDGSDRGLSVCSNMPTNRSPGLQPATSPTSDISRRTSASASTRSPPRNLQGQITCNHYDCASAPPSFSRKCEYT
jgi:hypothetical protein